MDFEDKDLDDENFDWTGAPSTPHRIHGKGQKVYWRDCDGSLYQSSESGEGLILIRPIERRTGYGTLSAGLMLVFVGSGGQAKG